MRRVFRRSLSILPLACLAVPAIAQNACPTNYAQIIATEIGGPTPLASGSLVVIAHDASGDMINYEVPGVGVELMRPKIVAISNGALASTFCLPRTDMLTTPVGYHFTIRDTSATGGHAVVLDADNVAITSNTFDLDTYPFPTPNPFTLTAISLTTPTTVTIGSVATLPSGSPATVTNSGTLGAAVLNFALPAGPTGPTFTGGTIPQPLVDSASITAPSVSVTANPASPLQLAPKQYVDAAAQTALAQQGSLVAAAVSDANSVLGSLEQTLSNGCRSFPAGGDYPGNFAADGSLTMTEYPSYFTAADVQCFVSSFTSHPDSAGDLPFAVTYSGGNANSPAPAYFDIAWDMYNCIPGAQTSCAGSSYGGNHAEADGDLDVPAMELLYYEKSGSLAQFTADASVLETALARITLDATTGLVYINPSSPYICWGFQESIRTTGLSLSCSLYMYRAATSMATLYTAAGNSSAATRWTAVATKIAGSLDSTSSPLWNSTYNVLNAGTVQNQDPDIYGSAFCVYLKVCSGAIATDISAFLNSNLAAIAIDGYVDATYNPGSGSTTFDDYGDLNASGGNGTQQYGAGGYQNGRWSVADLWVETALAVNSPANAMGLAAAQFVGANPNEEWYDVASDGVNTVNGSAGTNNLESPMGSLAYILSNTAAAAQSASSLGLGTGAPSGLLDSSPAGGVVHAYAQDYVARIVAEGGSFATAESDLISAACTANAAVAFNGPGSTCPSGSTAKDRWTWSLSPTNHLLTLTERQTSDSGTAYTNVQVAPQGASQTINGTVIPAGGTWFFHYSPSIPALSSSCIPNTIGVTSAGTVEGCNSSGAIVTASGTAPGTPQSVTAEQSGLTVSFAPSVTLTDNSFEVVVAVGASAVAAGSLYDVKWSGTKSLIPVCVVTGATAASQAIITSIYPETSTTDTYLASAVSLTANTTYVFNEACN